MDDLLGFGRFDQHTHWRTRGRVEGEVDEIEPSTCVQDASGLTVEVIAYDDQTDLFQFILLDADGEPRGLVSRLHDWAEPNPVFGGIQHRTDSADWVQHLDTTSHDPLWIGRIVKALEGV